MVDTGAQDLLLARLHDLIGANDDGFIAEMLGDFLRELPALEERLAQAVQGGNPRDVTKAAHSLRSGASALGASGVARTTLALEMALRDQEPDALPARWEAVGVEVRAYASTASALMQRLRLA